MQELKRCCRERNRKDYYLLNEQPEKSCVTRDAGAVLCAEAIVGV
jgi:hypothetical protein